MKCKVASMLVLVGCLWMYGCEQSVDKDEPNQSIENINEQKEDVVENYNMNETDNVGLRSIGQAPETTEKKSINDVVILYFSEYSNDTFSEPIAVNIVDNQIYVNPSLSLHRFSTFDKIIKIKNSEAVLHILKDFEVQSWKKDYSFEQKDTYVDGASWMLWLQFEDGSVEKYSGSGTSKEEIIPDNFTDFEVELQRFVESAIN